MRKLILIGIVFFSLSWLFLLPFFVKPYTFVGLILLASGWITTFFTFKNFSSKKIRIKKIYVITLPLLIPPLILISFPYNIGVIFLVIAMLVYFLFPSKSVKYPLFLTSIISGYILILQTTFLPFYQHISARFHDFSAMSPLVSFLSTIMGIKNTFFDKTVYVFTSLDIYPFTVTSGKLGIFPFLLILIGIASLVPFIQTKKRFVKTFLFLSIGGVFYLILRYIFLMALFIATDKLEIFWDPFVTSLTFIPFSFLSLKMFSLNHLSIPSIFESNVTQKKLVFISVALVFVFIFSMVGTFSYQDPGVKKSGMILIDEVHSGWENTTKKMDKEWYGTISTYNYYCWASWLDKYYKVFVNTNSSLKIDLLKQYDILILKCPTTAYSDEEINAVKQFVEEGGGLYLIGDHTNVFGMNYYLNQVAKEFGITFNYDATYDSVTLMHTTYTPQHYCSHPIVQFVPKFSFLTSCTLNAPLNAEDVIVGYGLLSEPGTYSTNYFFRRMFYAPDAESGVFLQTVALKYGKGRVVAFTDSTVFSNFAIFMDGYPNFTLGTMEYLNRENLFSYLNVVFGVVAIAAATLSLYLLRKENRFKILLVFIVVGVFSFSIAAPVFTALNEFYYPLPQPHTDFPRICFVQGYSDFNIEPQPAISSPQYSKQFGTFFIWTQRVGYVPSVEETLRDAVDKGDVVVIINPVKTFSLEDKKLVSRYLEKGGNLILMDSIINQDSTSNQLLGFLYGDTFKLQVMKDMHTLEVGNSTGEQGHLIAGPYLAIVGSGFTYSVLNDDNHTAVAVKDYGEGRVIVVVDSYSFSNAMMGGSFTVPDKTQRAIYETEYYILENLVGGKSYTPLNIS